MKPLAAGQPAPEFRLRGPGGSWVSLSDYRGRQNVVLVFFPLAFSPICSHQLPEMQKRIDEYRALDAEVLGVSIDSHYANSAFARALGLDFPLLSDIGREAMTAYGVLDESRGYSGRATFLIDTSGKIAHVEAAEQAGDMAQVPSDDRLLGALRALRR